jgi:predicted membrane protein
MRLKSHQESEDVHELPAAATAAPERQENYVSDEHKFDGKKFSEDLRARIHADIQAKLGGKTFARGGLIWGGILLLAGVAFLLDSMGILPVDRIFRLWPLILIGVGAAHVLRRENRVWGVLLLLVGTLFLLDNLGFAHFRWAQLWPLALIVAGVLVMWNSLEARRPISGAAGARNTLNELAFFGGIERRVTTQNFEGGVALAIFGGIEIDLRQAGMEADEAVLEVNSVFGGVEVRVPETWHILTEGHGIFGGYTDRTIQTGVEDLNNPKKKTLLIRGAAVFGGVEIKN